MAAPSTMKKTPSKNTKTPAATPPAGAQPPSTSAEPSRAVFRQAVQLHEQGKLDEAALLYRKILLANPKDVSAWMNLGTLLRTQGHHEAALAATHRALELDPNNASVLTNYGNGLLALDRNDEALAAQERAVDISPDSFLIRSNYAIGLRESSRQADAVEQFDIACKMKPEDAQVKWERAITYLDLARFAEGWDAFEIRWQLNQLKKRDYTQPQWRGEDLTGKTIVIHEEQGFGDTMLSSRYIPLVKKRGARVILQCNKALHRLFSEIEGLDRVMEIGAVGEPYDYHVPMMSLPGLFKTDFSNIPPPAKFHVPAKNSDAVQHLLNLGNGRLKVGIVWSGSVTFARNAKRAVNAERFLPFANIPGVQLYSLQKGPPEVELHKCGGNGVVLELGPFLNDFSETAAAVSALDLVIMTDSSVAHLTGSLGKPVWNLLCYRPYWLYTNARPDCAWYPSMRYFKQQKPGDWDAVFARAYAELEKLAAEKASKKG